MTPSDVRVPNEEDPPGTLYVLCDESFEPHVAVAAVLIEGQEAAKLDVDLGEFIDKVRAMHFLEGLPSFGNFLRDGLHASADAPEVRGRFITFLSEVLSFKSMIMFSDGSSYPGMEPLQRELLIVGSLARDIVRRYRRRPRIVFIFESAGKANPYVRRAVDFAAGSLRGAALPEIRVEFGTKRHPDLLAIPDYVLHVFNRFFAKSSDSHSIDVTSHETRSLLAILGSVSVARSLENEYLIRRGTPHR